MTPANIVGMAMVNGLDLIALTDHNTCKNCPAFMKMAREYGITALPGMELTTAEEIHVVCLFPDLKDAMAYDAYVEQKIVKFPNDENIFGKEQIYNENDEIAGTIPYYLTNATEISFDDVFDLVSAYNGIMFPAHIDKPSTSLLSQFGFIPPDSRFTCVEIKDMSHYHELKKQHPYLEHCRIVSNSDAHYLEHIRQPLYTLDVPDKTPQSILKTLVTPP